jgi:hypothetical protein
MRILLRITLLGAAFALATVALGWIAVPAIGLLWGLVARGTRRPALTAGAAALAAWAVLLAWTAVVGRLWALLDRLVGLFHVPGFGILIVTLALAGALAGLGAVVGTSLPSIFQLPQAHSVARL